MSLASQSQINLEAGETEEIIRNDEANRAYHVEIVGDNDVRIGHNERYASDGTTLTAGQKHRISNLQGQALYASAFSGPTALRVREAAANVESQPEKEVSIINADNLELTSNVGIQDSGGAAIDPATDPTLSSTLPREISSWNAGSIGVDVNGTPIGVTVTNPAELTRSNQAGIQSFTESVSGSQSLPDIPIADEFALTLKADVNNGAQILVGNFPLGPGEGLTLEVTNASVVTVEPISGTQDLHGIMEA